MGAVYRLSARYENLWFQLIFLILRCQMKSTYLVVFRK